MHTKTPACKTRRIFKLQTEMFIVVDF